MEKEFFDNETVETAEEVKGKKKDTDTKAFRADAALIAKLNELLAEAGFGAGYGKGEEAVKHFINLLELDNARKSVPGSSDMIETFNNYIDGLQKSFLFSLELKESAEERAEQRVQSKIETKEKTIAEYQAKNEALKGEIEVLKAETKENKEKLSEALKTAQSASESFEAIKSSLADKNALLDVKNAEIERLKIEVTFASEAKKELETLKAEASEQQKRADVAERAAEDLKAKHSEQLEAIQIEHEKYLALAKREAAIEAREEALLQLSDKLTVKDDEIARLKLEIMKLKLAAQDKESEEL